MSVSGFEGQFLKPPAFLFYPDDFLGGTITMTNEERGLYVLLLCLQWNQGAITENDVQRCAGGMSAESIAHVRAKFLAENDGKLRNFRLETVRKEREDFVKSRVINGSKGGRPRKPSGYSSLSYTKATKSSPSPLPSPLPSPNPDSNIPSPLVKSAGKQSKLSDSEWIASLKGNPAYSGIDIDRELGRMQAWASEKKKIPSRARFLNWLNRAEAPMGSNGHATPKQFSLFELKTILQAKENQSKAIKDRFSSEAAMGTVWSDQAKRQEWKVLRKSIQEITNRIANYAIA